jgi:hypothetical protein
MRAAGDHSGTSSHAVPAVRPKWPGSQRHRIPRRFISPPGSSWLPAPHFRSSAGNDSAQPSPVLPLSQPKSIDRVHNALRPRRQFGAVTS